MFTVEEFITNQAEVINDAAGVTLIDPRGAADGASKWDSGLRRPFLGDDGRAWVNVTTGYDILRNEDGSIIKNNDGSDRYGALYEPQLVSDRINHNLPVLHVNNATTLTKDQWVRIDQAVMQAVRQRLKAWADLRAANTMPGFDAMTVPIIEYEVENDPGEAQVDMEGLAEGRTHTAEIIRFGMPLPITHSDFHISERFLAVSRSRGVPLDVSKASKAGRRVAETVEKTTIGVHEGTEYGSSSEYSRASKVYGYRNFPARTTKTDLTAPTPSNGPVVVSEILEMIELANQTNFFGPYVLYVSTGYDEHLDNDYKTAVHGTTRERINKIAAISSIRRLDFLSGTEMLLVQMTSDVAEAVNGSEITTVQWDTKGGMQRNFKVMGIQVPRLKSVFLSGTSTQVTGIIHGTTS